MKVGDHALIRRIVVHVAHHHDLDSGVLLHQSHGVLIDDLSAPASQVPALSTNPGWQVGHVESEHLIRYCPADFEDVPGTEIGLLLRSHAELDVGRVKSEWDRAALQQSELVRPVEQGTVHAAAVRTVIMDNLVVGLSDLRLDHELFQDVAVLDLADSQDGVPDFVVIFHRPDDLGHVVELLAVLGLCPLIRTLGKVLIVILALVVIGVEQVLKVVEPDDMALLHLLGKSRRRERQDSGDGYEYAD